MAPSIHHYLCISDQYGSGGAGGIFSPALFIGGMLGGVIGYLDKSILQHSAWHEIANYEFSTYPVVDDRGGFVGLVTEARLRRTAAEGEQDQCVNEIVQTAALIEPQDTLVRAVVRMEKSGVRQLAVVDGKDGNRLLGLLTMSDIVRAHVHAALEAGC